MRNCVCISKMLDIMIYSFGTRVQITFISKLAEANEQKKWSDGIN